MAYQTRFRSAAFGPSTRLAPWRGADPASLSGRSLSPLIGNTVFPFLQGAGRLATSVPIFLMLFFFPTYSFVVGAVRVRICTRTPHLWARCGPIAPVPILEGDQVRGTLVGAQASPCWCAPILWHRPRVLDQSSTALMRDYPKPSSTTIQLRPRISTGCPWTLACIATPFSNSDSTSSCTSGKPGAITGLDLVDDDEKLVSQRADHLA